MVISIVLAVFRKSWEKNKKVRCLCKATKRCGICCKSVHWYSI